MASDAKGSIPFARGVLGVELTKHQKQIALAVERERRVAIKAAHSTGKTFIAACLAIWFAVRYRNSRVILLAPGWLQTRSVVWAEIRSLLAKARYRLPTTHETQTEIRLGVDNLIIGLSTNDAARLQGHHAEHVLIIVDEAPGIDESFWPAVQGILASGDSHLLLLGNPTVTAGYFYDCFGRNRESWRCFSISAFDSPNLGGLTLDGLLALPDAELDQITSPFLVGRRWVRERYDEWFNGSPENSPLWQSRVLGEFPSSSSSALIPLDWLERARRTATDNGDSLVVGIDPSGPGKDKTGIVLCAGATIIDSAAFTDSDARGAVLSWLKDFATRRREPRLVRVDESGIGFYFMQHIRDAGYRTIGINVGAKPLDPTRYANAKAERYWRLRERFQNDEVSGLTDEMLAELASITWLVDPHGRIAIEGKADVKAALGHSPDLAESLMIALGEGPPVAFEYRGIARGQSTPAGPPAAFDWQYPESREEAQRNRDDDNFGAVRLRHGRFGGPNFSSSWARTRGY